MNKALFIDRDGVLNQDKGYTHKISDLKLLDGVLEGLQRFQSLDYKIIIITNQSGIARGLFKIKDFHDFMTKMIQIFNNNKITINDYFFCPHHIDGVVKEYSISCDCRKPEAGMIFQAQEKYGFDLSKSVLIGDKESDILAGIKANIPLNIRITKNILLKDSLASYTTKDLIQAAEIIKKII
tara:strand:+ start:464 stop:1009 length:546 start_codon:yes stop_codon:yes gene_type:complete